jgi:hypothetical protein
MEDIFECTICTEKFNDPRVISCGHTFCKGCLLKLKQLRCPLCRTSFKTVDSLPSNFVVSKWIDQTKNQIIEKNKEIKCDNCEEGDDDDNSTSSQSDLNDEESSTTTSQSDSNDEESSLTTSQSDQNDEESSQSSEKPSKDKQNQKKPATGRPAKPKKPASDSDKRKKQESSEKPNKNKQNQKKPATTGRPAEPKKPASDSDKRKKQEPNTTEVCEKLWKRNTKGLNMYKPHKRWMKIDGALLRYAEEKKKLSKGKFINLAEAELIEATPRMPQRGKYWITISFVEYPRIREIAVSTKASREKWVQILKGAAEGTKGQNT